MKRSFGWIPDIAPVEAGRTFSAKFSAKEIPVTLPSALSYLSDAVNIGGLFQYELGTCVTQATMQGMRLFWRLVHGMVDPPVMSRLGWYWDARADTGDTGRDSGLYPSAAFDVLRRRGYALERYWPYDEAEVFTPPPAGYRTHMVDQENAIDDIAISAGSWDTVREVKISLYLKHMVVAGIQCDQGFMEYDGTGVWERKPGSSSLGRHYILIIGYDNDRAAFLCMNSWESWGLEVGGSSFFWMSYQEVASGRVGDVRAIRAAAVPSEMVG